MVPVNLNQSHQLEFLVMEPYEAPHVRLGDPVQVRHPFGYT